MRQIPDFGPATAGGKLGNFGIDLIVTQFHYYDRKRVKNKNPEIRY